MLTRAVMYGLLLLWCFLVRYGYCDSLHQPNGPDEHLGLGPDTIPALSDPNASRSPPHDPALPPTGRLCQQMLQATSLARL